MGSAEGRRRALKKLLADGLVAYRKDYAAYYAKCKRPNSPKMRDPNPTVVLIPGLGMIAWGKDKSESRVTAEFYNCAIEVMRGAEAIDKYVALPLQEAFDIEYWLLEEAKLQRMPPRRNSRGRFTSVIGAGSGIGKETAHRLARGRRAHRLRRPERRRGKSDGEGDRGDKYGVGIGVAAPALRLRPGARPRGEHHRPRQHPRDARPGRARLRRLRFHLRHRRHLCAERHESGHIPDDKWALTFNINVTGSYLVGDEAYKTWKEQGLKGNLVLTTSANAVVGKKGSRRLRRVEGRRQPSRARTRHRTRAARARERRRARDRRARLSAMFPRDRVIGSLAKYKIDVRGR